MSRRSGGRWDATPRRWWTGLIIGLLTGLLAGCGGTGPVRPAGASANRPGGEITVFAAASLTEVFTRLGADFEAAHPGTRVVFSFAGSAQLSQQLIAGAPADVFAAANQATMRQVTEGPDGGRFPGPPRLFARNQLVIVVPKGNPERIGGPADLAAPGRKVALCAPQVPCGAAAQVALHAAGVSLTPVTLERDVRAALTKVRLGEVDAALVYRTDALAAADEVTAIEFAGSAAAINEYPIVALPGAPNPVTAQAFVRYVLSAPARAVLTAAGFQVP